ncbi:MAG: DUF2158 domain-containing protein [Candidatus Marinimicrobia bacterium]|nr:DUF2158 domain-containing protein [Candidatus Neomarinimicrobiota bacterium]
MAEKQIKPGDTVMLKSGGPVMAVSKVKDEEAHCEWFDTQGEHHSHWFNLQAIEIFEGDTGIPVSLG